jgi:hypothetical protein
MTALAAVRPARVRRLLAVVRWGGATVAAIALAALVATGPPGTARAASGDNYNQMTGVGTTASTLTVPWTQGLLNSQNQPITTPGSELSPNSDREAYAAGQPASSPLSFMYSDFKNLVVTVSQTQNITHQGITVSWTGGLPTPTSGFPQKDFLQIMECYGDSSTGPSPEDCEYGSQSMLQLSGEPDLIDTRGGNLCLLPNGGNAPPSTTNPPAFLGDPGAGCDTYEGAANPETPSHCNPNGVAQGNACSEGFFYVPFVPADDPTHPIYDQTDLAQQFSRFDTNEVQYAVTNAQGIGQLQFNVQTNVEAPWLGCGAPETNGQTRNCWLVIVPRGQYEPNGFKALGSGFPVDGYDYTSPLSASNWAQRIQIHLSFTPIGKACPLTVQSRGVEGTQVVTRAMSSWQFALNQAANCSRIYTFTYTPETQTTHDLITAGTGVGMAFTTIPIGSEEAREGLPPPKLPNILYAPVAVTALDFGFNINLPAVGADTEPVNLTPQLLANALTQSYRTDLPDYVAQDPNFPGPSWSQKNPISILKDPAFAQINSAVAANGPSYGSPTAPLLVGDRSSDNQRVWEWIQSDPKTSSWLDGGSGSSNSVTADPFFVKAKLGKSPATDNFPQLYPGYVTCGEIPSVKSQCGSKSDAKLNSQYLLPVPDDFDDAASSVLSAVDKSATASSFSALAIAPDGTDGWWQTVGFEPPGTRFMWALSDTPDIAAYGLVAANLCDASGSNCAGPSIDSVTKALDSATPDSQGLLQVNPAKAPAGGYPLVDVVYAAVPTNQSAGALNDYADLIQYAAGQGQTPGSAPGDLPPGYLPLPASLQAKAQAVVRQIRALATPVPTQSTSTQSVSPTSTSTTTSQGSTPTSGTTPGPTVGSSAAPTSTGSVTGVTASGSPTPQGPVIVPPTAQLAGGTTAPTDVGEIRWALIAVLIIGAAGALAGTLLRSGRVPRWIRRANRTRT